MPNASKRSSKSKATATAAVAAPAGNTCLFSGEPITGKKSKFRPGYDAKLKGLVLRVIRGEAKASEIPAPCMKIYRSGETLVGFSYDSETKTFSKVGNFNIAAPKASKAAAAVEEDATEAEETVEETPKARRSTSRRSSIEKTKTRRVARSKAAA